jgi:hypothetical protein
MPKPKTINKLSDKLVKVSESFTVNMYDNGYMIEVSGRNSQGDWSTAKIMVNNLAELTALITEAAEMERDN